MKVKRHWNEIKWRLTPNEYAMPIFYCNCVWLAHCSGFDCLSFLFCWVGAFYSVCLSVVLLLVLFLFLSACPYFCGLFVCLLVWVRLFVFFFFFFLCVSNLNLSPNLNNNLYLNLTHVCARAWHFAETHTQICCKSDFLRKIIFPHWY